MYSRSHETYRNRNNDQFCHWYFPDSFHHSSKLVRLDGLLAIVRWTNATSDRSVCNSNENGIVGTIFNETSVTFAYRDIQFREAPKNKGAQEEERVEVAVGGHAIK